MIGSLSIEKLLNLAQVAYTAMHTIHKKRLHGANRAVFCIKVMSIIIALLYAIPVCVLHPQ